MIWLLFSNWRLLAWLLNYKREELPGEAEFTWPAIAFGLCKFGI
jgi:hypothetical protein